MEGKEFEIDNSIAQMTEYNKPITCNDPNDGENNQENINCNRNMNKNRIRLTESQLKRIVEESVDSILKEGSKKNWIDESYNQFNGLHRLAYRNQGMKEKIKEVAQFADIVAGVARSEGRDKYVKFYESLASNIFQMLNLWGFLDDMDD